MPQNVTMASLDNYVVTEARGARSKATLNQTRVEGVTLKEAKISVNFIPKGIPCIAKGIPFDLDPF